MIKIAILFILSYILSDCDDSILLISTNQRSGALKMPLVRQRPCKMKHMLVINQKDGRIITPMLLPSPCNPLGVRTQDPFIKSEVLYLLS